MATMQMLTPSFLLVAFLNIVVVSGQFDRFSKLELPHGVTGPESVAFRGLVLIEGPFTTVYDGRILKWQGPTVKNRTKEFCDGTTDPNKGPICGRPLSLSFQPTTGILYIADAFLGLLVVGPNGGLATQLAGGFKFPVGVDLLSGKVYFTDASLTFDIRNVTQPGFMSDSTGRLLRYNPLTRRVSILLSGLFGAGGPAISQDGTFVLVPEFGGNRILKYWLVGPKAYTAEIVLNNIASPNKIRRAGTFGEFWVAVSVGFRPPTSLITPQGVRINSNGVVLQTLSFATQFFNKTITSVQEQNGKLYVGSRFTNFIGVYSN